MVHGGWTVRRDREKVPFPRATDTFESYVLHGEIEKGMDAFETVTYGSTQDRWKSERHNEVCLAAATLTRAVGVRTLRT